MKKYILISSGIIIFILLIILIVNSSGSKPYREHNTAKRSLEESGQNYVKWEENIHLLNQASSGQTYLDACGRCNCTCGTHALHTPERTCSYKCQSDTPDDGCAGGAICDAGCMCGRADQFLKRDVSSDPSPTRDGNSGTWKFIKESSTNQDFPEYIVYGDLVHIGSLFATKGWLEACGTCVGSPGSVEQGGITGPGSGNSGHYFGCACVDNQNVFDVSTSNPEGAPCGGDPICSADENTKIWKILSVNGIPEGDFVEYGADIYLENQLVVITSRDQNKTFLNVCEKCNQERKGFKCAGTEQTSDCNASSRFDVSTSYLPNRDLKSGIWRIIDPTSIF